MSASNSIVRDWWTAKFRSGAARCNQLVSLTASDLTSMPARENWRRSVRLGTAWWSNEIEQKNHLQTALNVKLASYSSTHANFAVVRDSRDAIRGRDYVVCKVRKDRPADADNVTLLCSTCAPQFRKRDLPLDCRTVLTMQISNEKGENSPARIAQAPAPRTKEIRIRAIGLGKIDIIDAGQSDASQSE